MATSSEKPLLTGIVLCLNAADTLHECLQSLDFCDQVIVSDDGSTDGSIEIAKKLGARVIKLDPTESFADKRNQTLSKVEAGWVLFLDADEQISPELAKSIPPALKRTDVDGFFIRRRDTFLGKKLMHGEAGAMWLLRLARVGRGRWERTVHETWNVTGNVARITRGEILHSPHPTISEFLDSINRYTGLEVRERTHQQKPLVWVVWLQLFLYPFAKFIQNYFFRLGFLDGPAGFIHAYCMSLHSLITRIKILEYVQSG